MLYKILFAIFICCFFSGCDNKPIDITKEIQSSYKREGVYLANVNAIYGISVLRVEKPGFIKSGSFYIKNDVAEIKYGSRIDDADIHIENNILKVTIKKPVYIATDRWEKECIHTAVFPTDIDILMNKKEKEIRKEYESKSIKISTDLTKQYFQLVAQKYNLMLAIKFVQ